MLIRFGNNSSSALNRNELNKVICNFSNVTDFYDINFKKNSHEKEKYNHNSNLFTYNSLRFSIENHDYLDKIRGTVSNNYNLSLKVLSSPFEDLVINIIREKNKTIILFCPPSLSMFNTIKKFSKKLNKLLTEKNSRYILEIGNVL